MLELICKELGVEVEEEWLGNDGKKYKITKDGALLMADINIWMEESHLGYRKLIAGQLKPQYIPQEGDMYYTPDIKINKDYRYRESIWLNDDIDQWYFSNNMVFRTKEEAIEIANKMIYLLKE